MPLFVCDNCDCVDNTALGFYWVKDFIQLKGYPLGTALCSECSPTEWASGEPRAGGGKWHGKFPKVKWDRKREVINRNSGIKDGRDTDV